MKEGKIQKAYRGIMSFMSELKTFLEQQSPDFVTSSLYFGYMDMTYFAFTPKKLKDKKLKIAIVFLHEDCRFEKYFFNQNELKEIADKARNTIKRMFNL